MKDYKEFKPTSWSIDNKTSIFVITVIITLAGIMSYINLPKEKFPDIVIPTIYINTVYPGASPENIEALITKPIEKKLKSISGVKKLSSSSIQDFSIITVEFNTNVEVAKAKQEVKDKVDEARSEIPNDLPREPMIMEVNFSEMPILYVNLSGDYDLNQLKKYADDLKDRIEGLREITRVDIVGALEREIQINIDMHKMQAAGITTSDIERAVAYENMNISGGIVTMDGMKRTIGVEGQFKSAEDIKKIIVRSMTGAIVHLEDIADVRDDFKEKESYARLDKKNVITLNVIKRSGENLINASDKCRAIVDELKATKFPPDLKITLTGDQSSQTRVTLHDLINTIIIGFILVTLILMFFMGITNAIFVGLSVPLSMFLAFMVMPGLGFSLNMIVLFSFLLALGIVVDDAIVVIENTHRIFDNGKMDIKTAAKKAASEVFIPVFAGTMTTLAPFVPLLFWGGIVGKFMYFLPVTLIVTLLASLLVAYIMNPVFAVQFMKPYANDPSIRPKFTRGNKITTVIFIALALIFHLAGVPGMGNFIITILAIYLLHRFYLEKVILKFQNQTWPRVQDKYRDVLIWCLKGRRPRRILFGTVALLFFTIFITGLRQPKVVFFPEGDPNFIYVYINLPVGTDQAYTDSITKIVEGRVYKVIGEDNPIVESVISNVAVGASDPAENDRTTASNKSKVGVAFVDFEKRNGQSTTKYLDEMREAVKGIPGAEITVSKEQAGPPVGKPVNIEISGDDLEELAAASKKLKSYLDSLQIPGVEELKSDFQSSKPEITVTINRERAMREGISTAQAGMELRTAIFGKEVSKFRDENDDYPIQLRYSKEQRSNIDQLMNLKIFYRDMNMGGQMRNIPLSAIADVSYTTTYGAIKRKNQKRVITISSNVLGGYNPNEVVANVTSAISNFKKPESVSINLTGEQEDQKESSSFLGNALLASLGLIFLILVLQFNSISKPILILTEIIFSIIGVLLGFSIFDMDISIVMTGVGIIALAGIVVRNGILLVEFTDHLRTEGHDLHYALIEAGRTRMTPVLLTASATILGLIPLAVGLNMDFATLFSELDPHIYLGGESVAFWGPLSWTMIFGLAFATFLTLILVPVMYLINEKVKIRFRNMVKSSGNQ